MLEHVWLLLPIEVIMTLKIKIKIADALCGSSSPRSQSASLKRCTVTVPRMARRSGTDQIMRRRRPPQGIQQVAVCARRATGEARAGRCPR